MSVVCVEFEYRGKDLALILSFLFASGGDGYDCMGSCY